MKEDKRKKEIKALKRLMKGKCRLLFKGRFGKRDVRRKKNKKWQRWRKLQGTDMMKEQEDGRIPGTGYRTRKEIRFMHPSGFYEKMVLNLAGLKGINAEKTAARISSKIGRKKRIAIINEAKKLGIKLLNA
ncbi:MAG: 50S ribosomal protein L32e [Candidatus Diapherotrites archaeon]|uniref:50S ribosomal protein L32e n=1 Tax=Candidatus Iainarchaeum sp. TaxID=3101447 RepID=A0A8T4KXJ3_9ARCH|nr:50S ribosomal protein L32e [Candidatus Diapherotrites archaeon]